MSSIRRITIVLFLITLPVFLFAETFSLTQGTYLLERTVVIEKESVSSETNEYAYIFLNEDAKAAYSLNLPMAIEIIGKQAGQENRY